MDQPFNIRTQEETILYILLEFSGFLLALLSIFLLFSDTPLCTLRIGSLNGGIPVLVLFAALSATTFALLRVFAGFFSTGKGLLVLRIAGVLGGCIAPFGLLFDWFMVSLPLVAIGLTAVVFYWCSYLSSLSHRLLVSLTSIAFAFAAMASALISLLNADSLVVVIIGSGAMLFSCILVFLIKDGHMLSLLTISKADSRERATHAHIGRWSYLTIGLGLGFTFGVILYFNPFGGAPSWPSPLLIAGAILVPSIALLVFRNVLGLRLEKFLMDYSTFTITMGLLPLPFMTGVGQIACILFLVAVFFMHLIIVVTVIAEVIRFEEVSPLWYCAELSFICVGFGFGLALGWTGNLGFWQNYGLVFGTGFVIAFHSFTQIHTSRGAWPVPNTETTRTHAASQQSEEAARGGAFWRRKVENIGREYSLSPRQREVLVLLAKGRDAAYIAQYFSISSSTAKSHIYSIYGKLKIHSQQNLLDLIDTAGLDD